MHDIISIINNIVLQHALHVLNSKGIEVAILMFDDLMVYGDYYNDTSLLEEITEYVAKQLPDLNMVWSYKEHDDSLQIPDDFDEADALTRPYDVVKKEFEKNTQRLLTNPLTYWRMTTKF